MTKIIKSHQNHVTPKCKYCRIKENVSYQLNDVVRLPYSNISKKLLLCFYKKTRNNYIPQWEQTLEKKIETGLYMSPSQEILFKEPQ